MASLMHGSKPEISVRWEQDKLERVVRIAGHLTSATASYLQSAIVSVGGRRLVIDLSEVTEIDDTCIAVLAELRRRLGSNQVEVKGPPDMEIDLSPRIADATPGEPLSLRWPTTQPPP